MTVDFHSNLQWELAAEHSLLRSQKRRRRAAKLRRQIARDFGWMAAVAAPIAFVAAAAVIVAQQL